MYIYISLYISKYIYISTVYTCAYVMLGRYELTRKAPALCPANKILPHQLLTELPADKLLQSEKEKTSLTCSY